jgi:hypothetical protein
MPSTTKALPSPVPRPRNKHFAAFVAPQGLHGGIIDDLHGTTERTGEIESYPAISKIVGFRYWLTAQDRTGIPDRHHVIRPIRRKLFYSLHHSFRSEGRP